MARIKKIIEHPPADWQVTFCALSIILVAFFVMLCSYATMEKGKMIEVQRSFAGSLLIFTGGVLFDKGDGIVMPSPDDPGRVQSRIVSPINELIRGRMLQDKIDVRVTDQEVRLVILDRHLFAAGTTELQPAMAAVLVDFARLIAGTRFPIEIRGHSDDREGVVYQWTVSAGRAAAVMQCLHDRGGLSYDRMAAVGFGRNDPFVPNASAEARARNRRVEIVVPLVEEFLEARDRRSNLPPSFRVWNLRQPAQDR